MCLKCCIQCCYHSAGYVKNIDIISVRCKTISTEIQTLTDAVSKLEEGHVELKQMMTMFTKIEYPKWGGQLVGATGVKVLHPQTKHRTLLTFLVSLKSSFVLEADISSIWHKDNVIYYTFDNFPDNNCQSSSL